MTNRIFQGDFFPEDHLDNPEYIDLQGRILLEEIYGDAYLEDYIGDAINLRVINGTAYFRNWQGNAPKLESIDNCAYFSEWSGDAPSLIQIGGTAYFESFQGKVDSLEIVGDAYFEGWTNDAPSLKTIKSIGSFRGWKGQAPKLESAGLIHINYNNLAFNEVLHANQINYNTTSAIQLAGKRNIIDNFIERIIGSAMAETDYLDFSPKNIARAVLPFYLLLNETIRKGIESNLLYQKNSIHQLIEKYKMRFERMDSIEFMIYQ